MEAIDIDAIRRHFKHLKCDYVDTIASTQNSVKLGGLLIAEEQTSGQGRRGNQWLTPHGQSICLSYKILCGMPASQLAGFQMAVAMATLVTIEQFEPAADVQLKWPNDLYTNGQKFAGILIHLTPKQAANTEINIGIGINWTLSESELAAVDRPISNIPLQQKPTRTEFIIALIKHLNDHIQQFEQQGLDALLPKWQKHDLLTGQSIELLGHQQAIHGQYVGISPQGELLLDTSEGVKPFNSGQVTLRLNH
ncbi:biotin--[acetyl-CoA-carboxylase] ligase [Marinicella sp. S1101]|uniref:biotin--[acetyl-CoA-carboxylase] ligase n=1 Tax=Marinicella marina TaxID=2996016 RepID=UPI002260E70C|nr:biotin--[acetyl-CoA-carboxylase] ligase [Marinicella marina]MCX7554370.1 biotin--[acetyl-CoA-carboxylase] ligase [Marinicella marina]MDJ1138639.1 biotin--[acetyl-CoA-carboxylase] ligase [Marinicella marina]